MRRSIPLALAVLAMLRAPCGWAAIVTTTTDSGPGSLRQAIANATPGETLTFGVSGLITLTSGELLITTNLTITGPGASQLTVQRSTAAGTPDFRVFDIRSGIVTISGLTVNNGRSDSGGGLLNQARAALTMHDVVFSGNAATNAGGGIKNVGTLTLDRAIISGNSASGGRAGASGGGIDNESDMLVSNSRIDHNLAVGGANADGIGGGINNIATTTLINCTLSSNTAEGTTAGGNGTGGGINNDGGTVTLTNCTVSANSVSGGVSSTGGNARGGGIANDFGTVNLDKCTVSGNSATGGTGDGGGIANKDGTVTLENSTVSGNSATPGAGAPAADAVASGGLFNVGGSTTTLNHSTVTANTAGQGTLQPGCAIFNRVGSLELKNTIVAGNTASFDLFSVESDTVASGGFNLIGRTNVLISPGPKDRFNVTGAELKLGLLQDNGGLTFTHALLCGSPAIDAGDNTDAPETDQRGFPRIVNGVIDIGAYEDRNIAPTVLCPNPATLETHASTGLVATVSVQVADADGDELVVVWSVDGTASQTNLVAAGGPPTMANVSFTTSFGSGSHSVLVRAIDTKQCAATCSTTVAIVATNTAPVALNDSYTVNENAVLAVPAVSGVLSNDSDADGDALTAVLVSGPAHAVAFTLNSDGSFSYTPAPNYFGPDSFTYHANDGRANSAVATVSLAVTEAPARGCELYPIALHEKSLAGVPIGGVIKDIYNGIQPGNFGWLTWAGSPSEPTLVRSLTRPGNSGTYFNPSAPNDHTVSVGDWVQGKPGVSNGRQVRDALDALEQIDITVPVWNQARGTGNNSLYRVAAFARVRLVSYQLPRQNRISARFLGFVSCQ